MTLVLDASVALKWFVQEEDSEAALGLPGAEELIAPELLVAEVANGLWKMERSGRLPAQAVDLAIQRLPRYIDRLVGIQPLSSRAVAIARTLDYPVYDCFYIALAEQAGIRLVTADRRLLERLANSAMADLAAHVTTFSPGGAY